MLVLVDMFKCMQLQSIIKYIDTFLFWFHSILQCAFSLGWKVHPLSFSGYTNDDVRLMKYTILSHELQKVCKGNKETLDLH